MLPPSLRRFCRVPNTHWGSWLLTPASAPGQHRVKESRDGGTQLATPSLNTQAVSWLSGIRMEPLGYLATDLGRVGSCLEEPGLFPEAASHDASNFHRLLQVPAL